MRIENYRRARAAHRPLLQIVGLLCVLLSLAACGEITPGPVNPAAPTTTRAETFTWAPIPSPVDFNNNGVDDYADLLAGAKADAHARPRYDASYFSGGYPPEEAGVCTDLVWRAFKAAGYDLKAMVDKDIAEHTALYPRVEGRPDRNIDFRRTANLLVFFRRHAQALTLDLSQPGQWQPGDIVTFGTWHSAIVSDIRRADGRPYLLHNMGQPNREEDALGNWEISGHFRFDASEIGPGILIEWRQP